MGRNTDRMVFIALAQTLLLTQTCLGARSTLRIMGVFSPQQIGPVIEAYEHENPGIDIRFTASGGSEVDDKFLSMVAGGQYLDVLFNPSVMGWARYTRNRLFTDLSPFMTRDRAELDPEDFPASALSAFKIKGKTYTLPYEQALPQSILYNAGLLASSGLPLPTTDWGGTEWSWDDMVGYAKKLTKLSADGKATQYGIDFWGGDQMVGISWAMGDDWYNKESYAEGVINKATLDGPGNLAAYQRVADLTVRHKVRNGSHPGNVPGAFDGWKQGRIAMWFYPQTLLGTEENPKRLKWGLAPFPSMLPGNRGGFAWTNAMAIPASSRNKEAAWAFMKWMTRRGMTKGVMWPTRTIRKRHWQEALGWWPMETCALTKKELSTFISGSTKIARVPPRDIIFPSQAVAKVFIDVVEPALSGRTDLRQALEKAQKLGETEIRKMIRSK